MRAYVKKCDCEHGTMVLRVGGWYECALCSNKENKELEKQEEL